MANKKSILPSLDDGNRVEKKIIEKKVAKPLSLKKASIKPFTLGSKDNMGLEIYDLVVFPNVVHSEQLVALEKNGVVRYLTGLDEYAPEVMSISNPEQKAAKILSIRTIVSYLEKVMASNNIDVDDVAFWDKVKVIRADNHDLFSKIEIRCGNKEVFLDPENSADDLIKLVAIKAGGFSLVAKSYEDAKNMAVPPKFYLDTNDETISAKTSTKKSINKAISLLEKLNNTNPDRLFYTAKILDGKTSVTFNNKTHPDTIYDLLDEYINGKGIDNNSKRTSQEFMDMSNVDMSELKIRALVNDSTFYNLISLRTNGMLHHQKTSTMLGRNVSEIVEFLSNPLNDDIKTQLQEEVNVYWNK